MPTFIQGSNAYSDWALGLREGRSQVLFDVGGPMFSSIEVGDGRLIVIGGPPGVGKTALTTQLAFEAVLRNEDLRIVIASVEMSIGTLFERQLARLSGVPATDIRFGRVDLDDARVCAALEQLATAAERIVFLEAPFDLVNLGDTADAFGAKLLVLDYVQRFTLPCQYGSQRELMGMIMSKLREFAELGVAIMLVSAVARGRGENGSTYDAKALGLASYRESSELEYGADSAWMLTRSNAGTHLSCLKNRHGEAPELLLNFDRARQSFEVVPQIEPIYTVDKRAEKGRRPTRSAVQAKLRERDAAERARAQQEPEGLENL